jgi:hypothetical protein
VIYHDPGLMDNSFDARVSSIIVIMGLADVQTRAGASISDYGAKASRDLIVTRGAGFRKEKNKKKRGVSTFTSTIVTS